MAGQHIGYIRVSSLDQHTERQLAGIELDKVFEDKASGKDVKRPQLEACLDYLREGDTLHVHSIDRLARNLQDLLHLIEELVSREVSVSFVKEGLTFTGQEDSFQRLQLQIIGAVAEFERSMIRERQREGIAIAKAAGKYTGRKSLVTDDLVARAKAMQDSGMNKSAIAKALAISRNSVYKLLAQ